MKTSQVSVIVSRMRSNLILNLNYTFKIPWDQMAAYDKIEALEMILEDLSREASDLAHEAQALKGW